MRRAACFWFVGLALLAFPLRAEVIINEFVAQNIHGLADEDGEAQDWLELYNSGASPVSLNGWSLTDDPGTPDQWTFPAVSLPAKGYLVVFASGKDRKPLGAGGRLHTNFKLSPKGEYLGLFNSQAPQRVVSEFAPKYPDQRIDYSYGRDSSGQWRYFASPTPGLLNGDSTITEIVAPVQFGLPHGFLSRPTNLTLTTETVAATIRYTFDGSEPTETNGVVYTAPLSIDQNRVVRAAAFKPGALPSDAGTQTYLFNVSPAQRALPVLSLVTATNNLYGSTGIIGISGGTYNSDGTWRRVKPADYYNPSKKGIAWERPVSVEFFRPNDTNGFTVDCGIRVHASDYFRPRMHASDKFSFTLYFRGDYGNGRLEFPWFTNSIVEEFNQVVLRAGSNDPINPFLRDEVVRRLAADTSGVASHGDFVNLFINGKYIKYYNPAERIDEAFCQIWHGGGSDWDVREQSGQVVDGTRTDFDSLMSYFNGRTFNTSSNYLEAARRVDLTNFVDYLLPLLYADTGDWPQNNWRAARERVTNGVWRFYVWDAEWSFGLYNKVPSHNPFSDQMSGTAEIPTIYKKLKVNPEFRLLFADRAHQHLFNGGALTDEHVQLRYNERKAVLKPVITSFDDSISTVWIPQRRRWFTNFLNSAGLLASSNAPVFAPGAVPLTPGGRITLSTPAINGAIYYTTDGSDPRVPFSGAVASTAVPYRPGTALTLNASVLLKARTLQGTNWSALTSALYPVVDAAPAVRFTEIMYHPLDGDAFEFLELQNFGLVPVDLSGMSVVGVKFRFPGAAPKLMPGARVVLISDINPAAFVKKYSGAIVAGQFSGSLNNGGEEIALIDRTGATVTSVHYSDKAPWPAAADGKGYSLELINSSGAPDVAANWRASATLGGSPGTLNSSVVVLGAVDAPVWLEIRSSPNDRGRQVGFPVLAGHRYTVQYCDDLRAGNWQTLQQLPDQSTSGMAELVDPSVTRQLRFYRVKVE